MAHLRRILLKIGIKNPPRNSNNFNNKTYKSICILR